MPRKRPDLVGKKFGHLTVVSSAPDRVTQSTIMVRWNCICDCGRETVTNTYVLTSGYKTKCGAYHDSKPKPDSKPKTPKGVTAVWKANLGVWQYQAVATRAPSDRQGYKWLSKSVGVYATAAEAEKAVEDYYVSKKWHPADVKTITKTRLMGLQDTFEDGVGMYLFKNRSPKKGSDALYRGVIVYSYPANGRTVTKYQAALTVNGETHTESGYSTVKEAYRARLLLEDQFLPKPQSIPAKNATGEANISIQHKRHVTSYVVSVLFHGHRHYGGTHATMREAMLSRNALLRSLGKMPLELRGRNEEQQTAEDLKKVKHGQPPVPDDPSVEQL